MAKKKKFYAVRVGRNPGIYTEWFGENGAETQVKGFPKPEYKSFYTKEEAVIFLKKGHKGYKKSLLSPHKSYIW